MQAEIRRNSYAYILLAVIVPFICGLSFALITQNVWEDYLINYRSSKNLAAGNGLVYDLGSHVHSFTSPIGVLLPAAIKFLTGGSDDTVIWIFRIIQCCILGLTGLLLLGIARELSLSRWSFLFLLGMFSLDPKILGFSTDGMEIGFLVFFIVLGVYGSVMPLRRPFLLLGISWAGLMWTRPDGFIYIIALSLGFLSFARAGMIGTNRLAMIKTFCAASLLAALLYLPWLIWAWGYYGSFVPHSLTAKAVGFDPLKPINVVKALLFPLTGLLRTTSLDYTFSPAYIHLGGWPSDIQSISRFVSWICCFAWTLPFLLPITRAISLATLITHLYLTFAMPWPYPWYLPGATLLSIIVLALLLQQVIAEIRIRITADGIGIVRKIRFTIIVALPAAVLLLSTLLLTICVGFELRLLQRVVEDGNRKQIGLWLHDHASSTRDRVFLEPYGYIGFYSNLVMYGIPGQTSPELVAARRALYSKLGISHDPWAALITYLKPDWLVLRPKEVEWVANEDPGLLNGTYFLEKIFDVSGELSSYPFVPGRGLLQHDETFFVYKRQSG